MQRLLDRLTGARMGQLGDDHIEARHQRDQMRHQHRIDKRHVARHRQQQIATRRVSAPCAGRPTDQRRERGRAQPGPSHPGRGDGNQRSERLRCVRVEETPRPGAARVPPPARSWGPRSAPSGSQILSWPMRRLRPPARISADKPSRLITSLRITIVRRHSTTQADPLAPRTGCCYNGGHEIRTAY